MGGRDSLTARQYADWMRRTGFSELRQILYWTWDPIGVNDAFPITAGEYDTYVQGVLSRLWKRAPAAEIAAYLDHVVTDVIGLGPRRGPEAADLPLAERIIEWVDDSIDCWIE